LIERTKDGWRFGSPYAGDHENKWTALLCQAFGTRSGAVMDHFLDSFTSLVGHGDWDDARKVWMPDQGKFDAMIAMVASLRPETEAQAAYAAQLCALHLSAMKLGEQASKSYADARTFAILSKTVRAYGDGLERMARLQGRVQPRTVNQTIQVVYVDQRDQRQQTLVTGGVQQNRDQPHRTERGATIQSAALPSHVQADGQSMSLSSCQGQAGVQGSWWGKRVWSALRGR
jgi:hypothetical protein